jgi:hypothetical protein
MKKIILTSIILVSFAGVFAQSTKKPDKDALKFNLNEEGTHYFQVTFLNQTWLRYNESNPGTTIEGVSKANSFDMGLRRTRIQVLGQISDKIFLYFQYGQNNFNSQYNINSNRKIAAFFHDAVGEYKVTKGNGLKLGAGLTIANGLSRFSQPSIGTIMTMDVPVFAQTTVDQIDEFSRKLSVYARGQVGKFDYRFVLSDPFPVSSAGITLPPIAKEANFAQKGHQLQTQGYLIYQFFEHENNTTPYMTGTYLGKKKIFNIAVGGIMQKNAMWERGTGTDTVYQPMKHLAVESFLDMPVNKQKQTAVSAYIGYFKTNYGTNYLRYNGIMNPANGTTLNASNSITNQGATYGNALPMFGTGNIVYTQFGYLMPDGWLKAKGKFLPYVSATLAKYDKLGGLPTNTFNAGLNYLMMGHKSKVTLDFQNRPVYALQSGTPAQTGRRGTVTMQYQIFF